MKIDEDLSHLDADLEIKCWSSTHSLYALSVGLPILLVWGKFHFYKLQKDWAFHCLLFLN
jgi:hypothetical protein